MRNSIYEILIDMHIEYTHLNYFSVKDFVVDNSSKLSNKFLILYLITSRLLNLD